MKIKDCSECPFRVDDWNPDSNGYDMYVFCNLAKHLNLPQYRIKSYDSWNEEEQVITTPDFCPLKKENLLIELI